MTVQACHTCGTQTLHKQVPQYGYMNDEWLAGTHSQLWKFLTAEQGHLWLPLDQREAPSPSHSCYYLKLQMTSSRKDVIITCTAAVIHNYAIRGKWKFICGERSWRKTWRRKEQQQRRSRKETHRTSDLWHRGRRRAAHSKLVFYWDYRLLSFFSLWCCLFRLIALLLLCCCAGSHRLDAKWGQCLHINKPSAATAH